MHECLHFIECAAPLNYYCTLYSVEYNFYVQIVIYLYMICFDSSVKIELTQFPACEIQDADQPLNRAPCMSFLLLCIHYQVGLCLNLA